MNDMFFMQKAMKQAYKALNHDEIPIGAILVDSKGVIVAQGYNQVEEKKSQLMHAELQVLKKAVKKTGDWRLLHTTLYVTVQPCMMCLGALLLSRVSRVVYGVNSPKFGMSLDDITTQGIYKNLSIEIECIDYQEARDILRIFFQKKRSMKHVQKGRVG